MKFTKRNAIVRLERNILIRIPLSTIVEVIWSANGTVTLTLNGIPLFFSGDKNHRSRLCSLSPRHAAVVGQCLVYQFITPPADLPKKIQHLKRWDLCVTHYDVVIRAAPLNDLDGFAADMRFLKDLLAGCTRFNSLPPGILFQLQALAYNAYLHPLTVISLTRELQRIFRQDRLALKRSISVDAFKKLLPMIDFPYPYGNPEHYKVSSIVEALQQNEKEIQDSLSYREGLVLSGRNLARIDRITITPTRITLHSAELEPNNRILRKFPKNQDCFIRAQFCDENGEDIFFSPRVSHDQVFDRFKDVMKRGIQIAGRVYAFLGFSHSSLRSHSAWVCKFLLNESS